MGIPAGFFFVFFFTGIFFTGILEVTSGSDLADYQQYFQRNTTRTTCRLIAVTNLSLFPLKLINENKDIPVFQ